jgi:ELWxxDGT repeat protein
MNKSTFTGLLLALFIPIFLQAQLPSPYLVKDINQKNDPSYPEFKIEYNGLLYFSADDGINGKELWRSDGTNTQIFSNIDADVFHQFHQTNNLLFFTISKNNSFELWVSDGNQAGTLRLDSSISSIGIHSLNNQLYFQKGGDIWVSDGTIAGTQSLKSIYPNGNPLLSKFTVFNNELYFYADDGVHGQELWKTDGTPNGTQLLKDISPGQASSTSSGLQKLVPYNNKLYFTANDGTHGAELWVTDGTTAGTHLFKDLLPGLGGSNPQELTVCNNRLLFFNRGEYNVIDAQIWTTDGDSNLVQSLHTLRSGEWPARTGLHSLGHTAFFFSDNDWNSPYGIWKTDGISGSSFLGQAPIYTELPPPDAPMLKEMNDKLYFMLSDDGLWQVDSSSLSFIDSFYRQTLFTNFTDLFPYQNELYFAWNNSNTDDEVEPYKIEPLTANWSLLQNINNKNSSSDIYDLASVAGKVYFGVNEFIWESDGSANNTQSVYQSTLYLPWSVGPCHPGGLQPLNNAILAFSCGSQLYGMDVFQYQASVQGFFMRGHDLIPYKNYYYFGGFSGLERTNGVSDQLVFSPPNALSTSITIADLSVANQELYFYMDYVVSNGSSYTQKKGLWASDGLGNTRRIKSICDDCQWNDPIPESNFNFISFKRNTFFTMQDIDYGTELWVTNGDQSGTLLHSDFGNGNLSNFFVFHDFLYFKRNNQLWRLANPTHQAYLLIDLDTLTDCHNARDFKVFNNFVYFIATDDNGEDILWMMNGPNSSFRPLLTPDGNPIRTSEITLMEDYMLFSNWDPTYGREVWVSGGFTHNTYRLSDIMPGSASSNPGLFSKAGNLIYFIADDGVHGRELWAIDALPLSQEIVPKLVDQDFKIYPSPSKGQFTIELSQKPENPINADLYNLQGQLLDSYQLRGKINSLEAKALPAGLYLLQLDNGRAVKIVIE